MQVAQTVPIKLTFKLKLNGNILRSTRLEKRDLFIILKSYTYKGRLHFKQRKSFCSTDTQLLLKHTHRVEFKLFIDFMCTINLNRFSAHESRRFQTMTQTFSKVFEYISMFIRSTGFQVFLLKFHEVAGISRPLASWNVYWNNLF